MLKRTALFAEHQRLGGRLIDFGGWELPVQYTGVSDEHLACRNAAGLFDVSHMGEVHVEGPDAERFLNFLVSNDVSKVAIGQAQYALMCNEHGGIVDDLVLYRRAADRFLVVVNASNAEKDFAHIKKVQTSGVFDPKLWVTDESAHYSQIAVQGPRAEQIVAMITTTPLSDLQNYHFKEGKLLNAIPAVIARTGYTGEDGFELYMEWSKGPEVWSALLEKGVPLGLKPCGLGARDTLRLEMKFTLYGNEIGEETNPLEAGLGWVVKLDKADFVGKRAIIAAKERGISRTLVGLKLLDRGIARHGYKVWDSAGAREIGEVTSGTQSPCTKESIAIASVLKENSTPGTRLNVDIRGAKIPAEVVQTPFYKRQAR